MLDHNDERGHCFKAATDDCAAMLLSAGYQSLILIGVK